MSPRAAWRLERLGYAPVYDYAAGKVDWLAAGLPSVRADTSERRAIDVAERDVPTCGPDDTVGAAREVARRAGATRVVVVNEHRVVLGRIGGEALEGDPAARVEDVLEPGPASVRANEPLKALCERMAEHDTPEVLVTTPEGVLLGAVSGSAVTDEG